MAHISENVKVLKVVDVKGDFNKTNPSKPNTELIITPNYSSLQDIPNKEVLYKELNGFIDRCHEESTIAILCSSVFAADYGTVVNSKATIKLWIVVKTNESTKRPGYLPDSHCALLILTKYKGSLNHTKTRIGYSYCPACDKTSKDYGGKKHLYHEYGTIMSDVWRDISVDFTKRPKTVIDRVKDLFGLQKYQSLNVYDLRTAKPRTLKAQKYKIFAKEENDIKNSKLINNDCIKALRSIPDNSIDFCFADPPYNLNKKYETWDDGIDIQEYFNWCDKWLSELARVLKPGRTVAVLNIPQWCIRHFKHLIKILDYQDWIVWEGLSMPVRMIMPAHYSILCLSKGKPRDLPGLKRKKHSSLELQSLTTFKEGYCIRPACMKKRKLEGVNDSEFAGNVWWDIHRLKHNSRRVDHPCQLPPMFMYRLIAMFTNEGETVLDPFNGVGTSTLTTAQLKRKYIGVELSDYYHNITVGRHEELKKGLDPFRKNNDDTPKAKNSPVERLAKQKYKVSKKILQLEIKKLAAELGRIPSKEDVQNHSEYPLEYFENYFISWGEVTAAARTTGMTENRKVLSLVD